MILHLHDSRWAWVYAGHESIIRLHDACCFRRQQESLNLAKSFFVSFRAVKTYFSVFLDSRQRTVFCVFLPPTRPRDVIYDVHGQPRSTSETPRRRPSSTSVCSSTPHTTTPRPARTYTTTQRPLGILHNILRHPQRFLPILMHFEFLSLPLNELLKL